MGFLVDLDVVGVDGGDVNRAGTKSMRRLRSSSWSMREMPSRTPRSCSLASSTGLSPLPPEASCATHTLCIVVLVSGISLWAFALLRVIHTEAYVGKPKVKSAAAACGSINSTIQVVEHEEALQTSNALEILSKYDIIVDATDNAPTRYLISDCCVVLGKPLVSGAALGLEGQLTVYNYNGGPCYRCLFPTPPPRTACQSCAEGGVLGVVPGIIGCLQALEAIKIAASVGEPLSGRMLLLDALSGRIRIVKIRGRSMQCEACGENATFTQQQFREFDYEKFTQTPLRVPPLKLNLLPRESRISSKEYSEVIIKKGPHVLVDVRPAHHFKIASLPKSLNIPLSTLEARLPEVSSALKKEEEESGAVSGSSAQLYVVCRRGNDSQRAVQYLHKMGFTSAKDIVGGLESWAHNVDHQFPTY
ncbi:adenylyltransferase and sulfurtransferase MOCS3 [Glycine max]|uniref:adenylyltransferase and sulfurtransferase MOCS3 n=1 Tax=Glycine max TaxID=3847 RepID=UPI001B35658B|nr:adenylyltransferase and sulfurtransferase MOCS3 [Glycine max]